MYHGGSALHPPHILSEVSLLPFFPAKGNSKAAGSGKVHIMIQVSLLALLLTETIVHLSP